MLWSEQDEPEAVGPGTISLCVPPGVVAVGGTLDAFVLPEGHQNVALHLAISFESSIDVLEVVIVTTGSANPTSDELNSKPGAELVERAGVEMALLPTVSRPRLPEGPFSHVVETSWVTEADLIVHGATARRLQLPPIVPARFINGQRPILTASEIASPVCVKRGLRDLTIDSITVNARMVRVRPDERVELITPSDGQLVGDRLVWEKADPSSGFTAVLRDLNQVNSIQQDTFFSGILLGLGGSILASLLLRCNSIARRAQGRENRRREKGT